VIRARRKHDGISSGLLGIFVAVGTAILLSAPALAQQTASPSKTDDLMMSFYKDPRPERLVGLLEKYDPSSPVSQRWQAYPPLVGLLAVVFRKHPERIEELVPANINPRAADALAAALLLSGNQAIAKKLQPRFDQAGSDETLKAQLAGLPPRLESIQIRIPTHLDILWGASFASGDGTFVLMILDYLAQTTNVSEAIAADVAQALTGMFGGRKEALIELRKKHGDAGFVRIVYAATALWALNANGMRHEFVEQTVAKYASVHADTPTGKLLALLRKSRRP
jgi:hypothetical protein